MSQQKCKSRGILRSRIADFIRLKGRSKAPVKRFSKRALRKTIEDEEAMKSSLLSSGETKSSEIQMTGLDEPIWMMNYRQFGVLLREVELLQEEIRKQKLKKMTAVHEQKHDAVMQRFVEQATKKLSKCQHKLKDMEQMANFSPDISPAGKRTFTSMLVSMASNIREQARLLRGQQQSELHRQRQLKSYSKTVIEQDFASLESQGASWLSQQEFEVMEKNIAKQRDEEITKIVQSIYSLSAIYKEFQSLVIEQGSLLDRIDSNIDSAIQNVTKGNEHLVQACKKQQSSCFNKLRLILIGLIMFLLLVFIIKNA